MRTRTYAYPVPEGVHGAMDRISRLDPLMADPDCWDVLYETLLVVETDRDGVLLKMMPLPPLFAKDGTAMLGPKEAQVPPEARHETEEYARQQFTGAYAWLQILCVRFEDPAPVAPFEQAVQAITGIPLITGIDGHLYHHTSAVFGTAARLPQPRAARVVSKRPFIVLPR